jgi:hypothetical protein
MSLRAELGGLLPGNITRSKSAGNRSAEFGEPSAADYPKLLEMPGGNSMLC